MLRNDTRKAILQNKIFAKIWKNRLEIPPGIEFLPFADVHILYIDRVGPS